MLKKTMIAGIAVLALLMAHDVRAADSDAGGSAAKSLSGSTSGDAQQSVADESAAAAAASIEPAAGGGNVFTATQVGNVSSGAAEPAAPAPGANPDDTITMTTTNVYP
jgi:hypothetical protein